MGEAAEWEEQQGYQECLVCGWIADECTEYTNFVRCPDCGSENLDVYYMDEETG